jgi:uncharacterized delta-60 repeat protein
VAVQGDGRILVGGAFTMLGGGPGTTPRSRIGRINQDGSLDTGFDPGANGDVLAIATQPDDKILVGGAFTMLGGGGAGGAARGRIGRLYPDGSLDTDLNPGAGDRVMALAVQPDGQIIVGGDFGVLGGSERHRIGRVRPDGSLDASFNPGANGSVLALAVQADGKIIVGGQFSMLGGGGSGTTPRNYLGRLNAGGSLDASFSPQIAGHVTALLIQPDGKILIGAGATDGSVTRYRISRLNPDGSLDASFDQGAALASPVLIYTLALQADGRILVGGSFTELMGPGGPVTRHYIARLESNGSLDLSFDPGANNDVTTLAVLPDGRILAGGAFTGLGGGTGTSPHARLGRIRSDGSIDPWPGGANDVVRAIALQTDGGVVVAGSFTTLSQAGATTPRIRIGRYLGVENLSWLDTEFMPGAGGTVRALAIQPDGKVVAGGDFTTFGGGGYGTLPRSHIGRMSTLVAGSELEVSPTTVTWSRSGAGPGVSDVVFELSKNGTAYAPLGPGARVTGGWQITGVSLSLNLNVFVRARGTNPANADSARSVVETVRRVYLRSPLSAPFIADAPDDAIVTVHTPASFTVAATGLPAPSFRWEWEVFNGDELAWEPVPLGGPFSGVMSAMLYLPDATPDLNGKRFRAVVTNAAGTAISPAAQLLLSSPPLTELARNGDFASGSSWWGWWATPDMSYIVWQVTDGVMKFHRVPPPPGTTNQAVILQLTNAPLLGGAPLVASFQVGNSSGVRKRISVLVHDSDFSDLSVCTFWLAPHTTLTTYGMETHTTRPWKNLTIAFYAASANVVGDTGFYEIDNVSVQYVPTASVTRTLCLDPTAPSPPGGADSETFLVNGDFQSGSVPPWNLFGAIQSRIVDGVFEFIKLPGTPAGVVFQATGRAIAANEILTATFELGNSSPVRKRVTAILHDIDFTDLSACTFWLEPGQSLSTYTYRAFATRAWTNATISVYPATVGLDPWIRLDNVAVRRTPSAAIAGVECLEPGDSSNALTVAGRRAATPERAIRAAAGGVRGDIRRQVTAGLRVPGEPGWRVMDDGRLQFMLPPSAHVRAIEVSADGDTWQTVLVVEPSEDWRAVTIVLDEIAEPVRYLRVKGG